MEEFVLLLVMMLMRMRKENVMLSAFLLVEGEKDGENRFECGKMQS